MKIINLGRGQGKTTRLLYASEFNDMPILCANYMMKKDMERKANEYGLKIPEPICVEDIVLEKIRGSEIGEIPLLVDEAPLVLANLLGRLGVHGGIKAITLTEKE